jgi:hypothetical protein
MSIGVLDHSMYYSWQKYNANPLTEYYTTTSNNQTINFIDGTNQLALNSLFIENMGSAVMYLQLLPSEYVLTIPAGESRNVDYVRVTGIKVLGNSGQTLRYSGCSY